MTRPNHLKRLLALLFVLLFGVGAPVFGAQDNAALSELTVFTYHDIVADPGDDAYAVSRSTFVAQMDYLQTHGYQPVTLSLLEKVMKKQASLPHKAVLLSFDDGLQSYYHFVAPLLKIYNFPSVLSVVTGWVDGKNVPPEYNGKLIQWPQLRELSQSPLVEVISHSHDLHHGVQSNPQGNEAAAGVTRLYSPSTGKYETEKEFRQRVSLDLKHSINRLEQELNISPIGVTWPYGRYDNVLAVEAKLLGLRFQLSLNDGPTKVDQFPHLNRIMLLNNDNRQSFIDELNYTHLHNQQQRFVEIFLDKFAGRTAEEHEVLLSALLNNLQQLDVNTVVVHPFNQDNNRAFFFNDQIEIAANILNRVLHQIQTRLGIRHVYLSLPQKLTVKDSHQLYTDLARLNHFNGVIFNQHTPRQIEQIKKIIRYFQPRIKFGHYGNSDKLADYDFAIIPIEANLNRDAFRRKVLDAKGLPTKLLIHVKGETNGAHSLPVIVETLKGLGVQHYGIAMNTKELYGFNQNAINTNEMAVGTLAVFGG